MQHHLTWPARVAGLFCYLLLMLCSYACQQPSAEQAVENPVFWSEDPFANNSLTSEDSVRLAEVQALKEIIGEVATGGELEVLLRDWPAEGASAYVMGHAWYQRGAAAYFSRDYELCIPAYEKAIDYLYEAGGTDLYTLITLHKNISQIFNLRGTHIDSALYYGRRAISMLNDGPEEIDANLVSRIYNATGAAAGRLGDYTLARQCFQKCLAAGKNNTVDYYLKAQTLYNYADIFYWSNELDSAYVYNQKSLEAYLTAPFMDQADSIDMAKIFQRIALVYEKWDRDAAEGLKSAKSAIHIFEQLNPDSRDLAASYNICGLLHNKLGQTEAALRYYEKAVDLNTNLGEVFLLGENYDNLGDWWNAREQTDRARNYYDKAIRCFNGQNPTDKVSDAQYRLSLFTPLVSRAHLLYQAYQRRELPLDDLFTAYAQIDTLLQSIRQDYTTEQSQVVTLAKIRPVYEQAISLCYDGWQNSEESTWLDRVITYFERSKGLVLQEKIQQQKIRREILSKADYEREQRLERQRNSYYQKSQNGMLTLRERAYFQDRRLATALELKSFRDTLARLYPQYRSLLLSQTIPDREDLQKQLSPDEQLIDFFVGEQATYCLSITENSVNLLQIPFSKMELTEKVQAFRSNLESPLRASAGGAKQQDLALRENGHALYRHLLATALATGQSKRLVLFPDDVLAYLPFEALLRSPVADDRAEYYHTYPFLIQDYIVSYQFSLGLWQKKQAQTVGGKATGVLAILPAQEKHLEVMLVKSAPISLPSLAYNQAEIAPVKALGRVDIMAGRQAKKADFMARASRYAVLHFAGHGNADPDDAYRSFLAFDLAHSEQPTDELVLLSELYTLNIPAEMVVLSACQTADGQLSVGEGVLSLSRAMTLAGARSVVSSLWLVNQESKVGFFGTFYQALSAGQPKDAALRAAKLDYLRRADSPWSHPYHWAGMVLVGEAGRLSDRVL